MNIKILIYSIAILVGVTLGGYYVVELFSKLTWMVDRMDLILWAILFLAGIVSMCTYLLCSTIKSNYK